MLRAIEKASGQSVSYHEVVPETLREFLPAELAEETEIARLKKANEIGRAIADARAAKIIRIALSKENSRIALIQTAPFSGTVVSKHILNSH